MFFQGRQEDAEEYLGFTLNGLHEEMLALKKLIMPQDDSKQLTCGYQTQTSTVIEILLGQIKAFVFVLVEQ